MLTQSMCVNDDNRDDLSYNKQKIVNLIEDVNKLIANDRC